MATSHHFNGNMTSTRQVWTSPRRRSCRSTGALCRYPLFCAKLTGRPGIRVWAAGVTQPDPVVRHSSGMSEAILIAVPVYGHPAGLRATIRSI